MIYIIIGIIVFAIVFYSWSQDWIDAILGVLLGAFLGIIAWLLFGSIIGGFLPEKEVVEEKPLYALTDATSTYGEKFLFSGYIDEKLTYRYIIETERGKHIEETSANKVYVNEGDYEPHVKIYHTEFAEDWYYLFAGHFETTYYEFYVPENTLTHNYQVDLE